MNDWVLSKCRFPSPPPKQRRHMYLGTLIPNHGLLPSQHSLTPAPDAHPFPQVLHPLPCPLQQKTPGKAQAALPGKSPSTPAFP